MYILDKVYIYYLDGLSTKRHSLAGGDQGFISKVCQLIFLVDKSWFSVSYCLLELAQRVEKRRKYNCCNAFFSRFFKINSTVSEALTSFTSKKVHSINDVDLRRTDSKNFPTFCNRIQKPSRQYLLS